MVDKVSKNKAEYLINRKDNQYEVIIGLEVHAQVTSVSKLFSTSATKFGAEPNTQVSLVDAAFPGMLPVINEYCVKQAIKTGIGLKAKSLDLVLSDMAPKATGHRFTDQVRAIDLVEKAIVFAQNYLSLNGNFVCKLLGANTNDNLIKGIKKHYKYVKLFKPKSSMKDSKEIYLICLSFNNLQ